MTSSRSSTDRADGCRTSRTTACRQPPVGACGVAGSVSGGSVTLVTLLEPWVAPVVVSVALPETLLIMIKQGQPGDPFRALPEVQMRNEQADGTTVVDRQRLALVRPHDPRLASRQVRQRQVRRIAGGRRREDEGCRGQRPGGIEQRVDADPAEARPELGPGGNAVDVAVELRRRQPMRLVPRPGSGLRNETVDGDRPPLLIQPRR